MTAIFLHLLKEAALCFFLAFLGFATAAGIGFIIHTAKKLLTKPSHIG